VLMLASGELARANHVGFLHGELHDHVGLLRWWRSRGFPPAYGMCRAFTPRAELKTSARCALRSPPAEATATWPGFPSSSAPGPASPWPDSRQITAMMLGVMSVPLIPVAVGHLRDPARVVTPTRRCPSRCSRPGASSVLHSDGA
jgi:hypothetical protein